jgi:hypothetical protein
MCEAAGARVRRTPGSTKTLNRKEAERLFEQAEVISSGLEQNPDGLTIRLALGNGILLNLHYDTRIHEKSYEWTGTSSGISEMGSGIC